MGSRLLVCSSAAETVHLHLVGVQDGVRVGMQVLGLMLEPYEVSEAETETEAEAEAGRPISDCWLDSGGMRQIRRACQTAAPTE